MRRRLKTDKRCWTHHIFDRCYHNHPPMTFKKGVEIIELIHFEMIDHLMKTGRPIEIRPSLGYLTLERGRGTPVYRVPNWYETNRTKKFVTSIKFNIEGTAQHFKFNLANKNRLKIYHFMPLRKHKIELHRRRAKREII